MTLKDIYLKAHAAVLELQDEVTPRQLAKAGQAAFDKLVGDGEGDLKDADFEAFDAHFNEIYRKLVNLDSRPTPATVIEAEEKRKATTAKLLADKAAENAALASRTGAQPKAAPVVPPAPGASALASGDSVAKAAAMILILLALLTGATAHAQYVGGGYNFSGSNNISNPLGSNTLSANVPAFTSTVNVTNPVSAFVGTECLQMQGCTNLIPIYSWTNLWPGNTNQQTTQVPSVAVQVPYTIVFTYQSGTNALQASTNTQNLYAH